MSWPAAVLARARPRRWLTAGLLWHLAGAAALAQPTAPTPVPATTVLPAPADTTRRPALVVAPDTARRAAAPAPAAEPTDQVTRRSAVRIGAAIVALTLSTLLLYNVRSR